MRKLVALAFVLWLLGSACLGAATTPRQVPQSQSSCIEKNHTIVWGETLSGIVEQETGSFRPYPAIGEANGIEGPRYLIFASTPRTKRTLVIPCEAKLVRAHRDDNNKKIARSASEVAAKAVAPIAPTAPPPLRVVVAPAQPATATAAAKDDVELAILAAETAAIEKKIIETQNRIEATRLQIQATMRQVKQLDAETETLDADSRLTESKAAQLLAEAMPPGGKVR